ncbi:hypothetical protein ACLGI4_16280 [Streptomyces sp. HMX112]|uniref:hypothetical protein n=1 Tax=Streptomyces sp. HMX112 TaxID=3390850 RepID=UPI003A7FDF03
MTSATFAHGSERPTAAHAHARSAHPVGSALRAVKVFAGAVFGVVVLGEYTEEAGIKRR